MKTITLTTALVFSLLFSAQAFAAKGGQPAAHGLSGKDFGGAVSSVAKSEPGAVGDHASSGAAKGGQPAAHGLSGKDFGGAVSSAAKSEPGAVGDHASGGERNGK